MAFSHQWSILFELPHADHRLPAAPHADLKRRLAHVWASPLRLAVVARRPRPRQLAQGLSTQSWRRACLTVLRELRVLRLRSRASLHVARIITQWIMWLSFISAANDVLIHQVRRTVSKEVGWPLTGLGKHGAVVSSLKPLDPHTLSLPVPCSLPALGTVLLRVYRVFELPRVLGNESRVK